MQKLECTNVHSSPLIIKINDCLISVSSKHDGLAGTRFGWGLVKDSQLAQKMWSVVSAITLSTSVDIELRVLNSMQAILSK